MLQYYSAFSLDLDGFSCHFQHISGCQDDPDRRRVRSEASDRGQTQTGPLKQEE